MMKIHWLSPLLSGMLALSPCAMAQSATNDAETPITFQAGAANVVVDVVVTGAHNSSAEGLSRDNFTVFEDGHEQQIVSFEVHPSANASLSQPFPPLPPGVYTNQHPNPGDDSLDVLLIDALNTPSVKHGDVRRALLAYLKTLPVNKPIAVFTLDTRLHQLEDFTSDHTALLKAVDHFTSSPRKSPLLKTHTDNEKQLEDEDQEFMFAMGMMKPALAAALLAGLQQFNAEQDSLSISLRAEYTLDAFNQLARYLSGMPGRKNVLWLSGSFPLSIVPNPNLKDSNRSARDFSEKVDQTAGLLAKGRVAVYPIDARGLFPQAYAGADTSGGSIARTTDRVAAAEADEASLNAQEQMTLEEVARVTGGEAISNTNDLKGALDEVDRKGAHFYTLVYAPSDKAQNDKVRHIEVRVHPGKYHLSYRRTYMSSAPPPKPDTFVRMLQHDVPASGQILFRLSSTRVGVQPATAPLAGSNPNTARPVTRYSIGYEVDAAPLQLTASGDGVLHGTTTLVLIAYDREGRPLNSISNTLTLHVPSAEYARFVKEGIRYRQQLDIPAQTAWLRAGVLDRASGSVGSLEIPFSVTANPPAH
ncbi:MAG: VWA domain-containing protein [Acidobacteriaceae bacterium]